MTIEIIRTTGIDSRSLALREGMDAETFGMYSGDFASMDPAELERLTTALHTDQSDLVAAVIAVEDGVDLGHAALRALAEGGYEVKKVYVVPSARGRGLSRLLMSAIEDVARELGETSIRLQTGRKQLEAIALYEKTGYLTIGSFGPYAGLDDLVYMEKKL